MTRSYQVILESIGEDPSRQGKNSFLRFIRISTVFFFIGLLKTPKRAAEVCMVLNIYIHTVRETYPDFFKSKIEYSFLFMIRTKK